MLKMLKTDVFFNKFSTIVFYQHFYKKSLNFSKKLLKTMLKMNFQQFQQPQQ